MYVCIGVSVYVCVGVGQSVGVCAVRVRVIVRVHELVTRS